MTCPSCGGKTTVTRGYSDCESIHRRRKCLDCNYVFFTSEYEAPSDRYRELCSAQMRKRRIEKTIREVKNAQSN